jgi:hypothetical protein
MKAITIALNGKLVGMNVFAQRGQIHFVVGQTKENEFYVGSARFEADETFKGQKGVFVPTIGVAMYEANYVEAINDFCAMRNLPCAEKLKEIVAKMIEVAKCERDERVNLELEVFI